MTQKAVPESGAILRAMRTRSKLSPGQIFTLLKEEFDARRPSACATCRVPLPFAVERPDDVSANWRIGSPTPCRHKCDLLLSELALRLAAKYDMAAYHDDRAATASKPKADR